MFVRFLRGMLAGGPFYLRVNRERVTLRNVSTGEQVQVNAYVRVDSSEKIVSVGAVAGSSSGEVLMPFQHPRVFVDNFAAGEKVFQHAFREIFRGRYFGQSPVVLVHPDLELEGGLSPIEARALREMAEGAGARKVFLHYGRQLSDQEVRNVLLNDRTQSVQ